MQDVIENIRYFNYIENGHAVRTKSVHKTISSHLLM